MNSLIKLRTYDSSDSDSESEKESDEICQKSNENIESAIPNKTNVLQIHQKIEGTRDFNDLNTNHLFLMYKIHRLPAPNLSSWESNSEKEVLREENHGGRIRSFPHEPGNWATFVYLPVNSSFDFTDFLEHLGYYLRPLNLEVVDDFHISLTRTVILRYHWIHSFTESIRKSLYNISCFKIHLCGLETYSNEQNTRTFLSLKVNDGVQNLKAIVNQLDNCLQDYNLESYYKNPSFHLSLFWSVGNKCSEINKIITLLPYEIKTFGFTMEVSNCFCVSGNKTFSFNFNMPE